MVVIDRAVFVGAGYAKGNAVGIQMVVGHPLVGIPIRNAFGGRRPNPVELIHHHSAHAVGGQAVGGAVPGPNAILVLADTAILRRDPDRLGRIARCFLQRQSTHVISAQAIGRGGNMFPRATGLVVAADALFYVADPNIALAVKKGVVDVVVEQGVVLHGVRNRPGLAVELGHAFPGAHPQIVVDIQRQAIDLIAGQAVFGGVVQPFLAVEYCQAVLFGAYPNAAGGIGDDGVDVLALQRGHVRAVRQVLGGAVVVAQAAGGVAIGGKVANPQPGAVDKHLAYFIIQHAGRVLHGVAADAFAAQEAVHAAIHGDRGRLARSANQNHRGSLRYGRGGSRCGRSGRGCRCGRWRSGRRSCWYRGKRGDAGRDRRP